MLSPQSTKVPLGSNVDFNILDQWRILGGAQRALAPRGGLRGGAKKEGRKRKKQGKGEKNRKEKGRQRRREGMGKKICKEKEGRNQKKIGYNRTRE